MCFIYGIRFIKDVQTFHRTVVSICWSFFLCFSLQNSDEWPLGIYVQTIYSTVVTLTNSPPISTPQKQRSTDGFRYTSIFWPVLFFFNNVLFF